MWDVWFLGGLGCVAFRPVADIPFVVLLVLTRVAKYIRASSRRDCMYQLIPLTLRAFPTPLTSFETPVAQNLPGTKSKSFNEGKR